VVILDSSFARPGSALAPIWGGKKGEFRDWTMANEDLGCLLSLRAGVLLGRVSVTTLRPPSVRWWGMGEGKSEKIFFALPPPISFLLPIVHPLGRSFFLSPVFHCLKNSRWRETFYDVSARTKKSRLLCRLLPPSVLAMEVFYSSILR